MTLVDAKHAIDKLDETGLLLRITTIFSWVIHNGGAQPKWFTINPYCDDLA